ncbi:hypothetical protein F3J29_09600 [Enterobacter sp. Cy-643]|nr:hypothetical protein [Enterobacter sp. Cy-643]
MQYTKKKPAFSCELFFKYGGEGGMLLAPSMALALRVAGGNAKRPSCRFGEPGRGFSPVPRSAIYEKKARICMRALL